MCNVDFSKLTNDELATILCDCTNENHDGLMKYFGFHCTSDRFVYVYADETEDWELVYYPTTLEGLMYKNKTVFEYDVDSTVAKLLELKEQRESKGE